MTSVGPLNTELRIICAGGFKTAMLDIAPRFEAASGHKLSITFGTPKRNNELISAGPNADFSFDVVVVTAATLSETTQPHIAQQTRFDVALSPVGMGVRGTLTTPDITSVETFKAAVMSLASIGLSDPTSGTTLANDIIAAAKNIGVSDEIEARKRYFVGPGSVVSIEVGKGNADAVMTLATEIIGTPGVRYLGAVPHEMKLGTTFTAAIASARETDATAAAFLAFLRTAEARTIMRAKGLHLV
jgi:molybdate transport system substrate-binding protein